MSNKQFLKYALPSIRTIHTQHGVINLVPGLNDLDVDLWDKIKDSKAIKNLINSGNLNVMSYENGPAADKKVSKADSGDSSASTEGQDPIQQLNIKDAQNAVKDLFDLKRLEALSAVETRAPVKKIVDKQIERINAEATEKDKK